MCNVPSRLKSFCSLSAFILAAGCASQAPEGKKPDTTALTPISSVSAVSCPDGVTYVLPEKISLTSAPVSWTKDDNASAESVFAPLRPVALYELNSPDSRFGGLSGLDFIDEDTLVMVSDFGSLIWMDLDPETVRPAEAAYITSLKDEAGKVLDGKTETDAEGITWTGQTLFVSLERDHRVLGYDIEGCGAAARGALVAQFSPKDFIEGRSIEENSGLEALTSKGTDTLLLGLEARIGWQSALAWKSDAEPDADFSLRLKAPEITMLTDLDYVPANDGTGRLYSLHRSYDPLRGNRIALAVTRVASDGAFGETTQLKLFGSEVTIDNFEGISVQPLSDATDRIVMISDDNFSDRQKTLLAIFEYDHG